MSIADKLATVAENIPKVYKAGQSSMVDESKIIEKTVSGAFISVDDVSEIPHKVGCRVSGVDDLTSVKVTRCGKNLFDKTSVLDINNWVYYQNGYSNYPITGLKPNTKYTFSMSANNWSGASGNGFYMSINNVQSVYSSYAIVHDNGIAAYNPKTQTITSSNNGDLYLQFYNITTERLATCFNRLIDLQLEIGSTRTNYEPYKTLTEYTPNADGTVEGMTSLSPYMNVFTDNAEATLDVTYRKSWGMQTEYDRFWDSFQNSSYAGATSTAQFAGRGWNINTFKPKYDIKVTSGFYLFYKNGVIGDLVEILNELGVSLDTSKITSAHYLFCDSYFSRVGEIDFRNLKSNDTAQAFASPSLRTIDKLIVKEESNVLHSSTFTNATGLKNITIVGTLACSVNFKDSPLSKDSILSVFNSLSDTITGKTLTLKLSAVNTAFETSAGAADGSTSEEWATLIATKPNWTISLV